MNLIELALRYMLSQAGITSLLTGVETVSQVRDNLAMFGRGGLPTDLLTAIETLAIELPERLVTPALWAPKPNR